MKNLKLFRDDFGDGVRLSYQEKILDHSLLLPQPVEYNDIDNSLFDFIGNEIKLTEPNGKKIKLFKLFSNQRFSEYSQTWEHTDEDGNLLMNFMTINRETNPNFGTIHGGNYNIPGNNRFTVLMRDIVDKNGIECYEITSMSQPLSVDIIYTISLITTKFELINEFNTRVQQLYQSRQCYIRPNGHYMSTILDNITDESVYNVDSRKFYKQSIEIKVIGYIIPKNDIKVELKPKRKTISIEQDNSLNLNKPYVDIEYNKNNNFNLNIKFPIKQKRVIFTMPEEGLLCYSSSKNIKCFSIFVNDDELYKNCNISDIDKIEITLPKIKISQDDEMKIMVIPISNSSSCELTLKTVNND